MDAYLFVMCVMRDSDFGETFRHTFEHDIRNFDFDWMNEWRFGLSQTSTSNQNNIEQIIKSLTLPIFGLCLSVINGTIRRKLRRRRLFAKLNSILQFKRCSSERRTNRF